MILSSCLLKYVFKTVTVSLRKSESPVSITQDDWKLRDWFVRIRPIYVGLS